MIKLDIFSFNWIASSTNDCDWEYDDYEEYDNCEKYDDYDWKYDDCDWKNDDCDWKNDDCD